MARALEAILAHAGRATADARAATRTVALAVDAEPVAATAIRAAPRRAIGRRPALVAHALLVDARAMPAAAIARAQRGAAVDPAEAGSAVASAIVALAVRRHAPIAARLYGAVAARVAIVALAHALSLSAMAVA